ncbi:hypothetical protein LTR84_007698 [Exophiala bonariae]|uniref:FAD dependent oxidoreductase domain-containing protein n=1 Tax=Exophiala bonariae TaxID=1690606 RepID=A0AAV9NMF5_9EURO|nr:hypothetical protein LTR84_007698 [Exophiala bonariae]
MASPEILRTLAARLDKDPGFPVENATPSFWQDPPHAFANQRSEQLPTEADVVIIGSGITGISISLHLSRIDPSLKIVMLEARAAISGATGRNGGHIKTVPFSDYGSLKAKSGKESAIKITKFRLSHLDVIVKEAELLGKAGEVGLVRRVEALCGVYDPVAWDASKNSLQDWFEDFPEERSNWTAHEDPLKLKELGLINASGCIIGPAGAAWPYRFLGVVLSKLIEEGHVTLETHTPATGVERTQSSTHPYQIQTARGSISTKHIIHCTNAHAAHLLPALRGALWPLRGQMTVQAMPPDFPRVGATRSWSAIYANGFDYITQSPGEDGSLYLGGGFGQGGLENEEDIGSTDDSQLSIHPLRHLEAVPGKVFANAEGSRVERKWTGIMGFTGDYMPVVDRLTADISGRAECDPAVGGEWIAAGFNGYGMVHSWLSGKAVANLLTGRETEILDWFPRQEFACSKERLAELRAGPLDHFFK